MGPFIILGILVVVGLLIIISNVHIVPQSKAFVVERLGAYHQTWKTGLHIKVPFIDKIAKRLPKWKGKFLSLGGRLILINAVLSSIPIYFLSYCF